MEEFWILLGVLAVVLMLALIFVYNHYDRLRFHLERYYAGAKKPLQQWVQACATLRGGDDAGYSHCKKLSDKTACLRTLVETTADNSDEKLDLQESLLEFCGSFNFLAEKYNSQLENRLSGKLAKHLGFRPIEKIDFYPEIKPSSGN